MPKSICVHGPQGSGKTTHAPAIASHFGLTNIEDEGSFLSPARWPLHDTLILCLDTNDIPPQFDGKVMSINEAKRVAGLV